MSIRTTIAVLQDGWLASIPHEGIHPAFVKGGCA